MKRVIHVLAWPLHAIIKNKKHWIRALVGSVVAVSGVLLAQVHFENIPHLMTDVVGYGIHGVGFTNVLKVINELTKLDL
jgi:hypothetical protein